MVTATATVSPPSLNRFVIAIVYICMYNANISQRMKMNESEHIYTRYVIGYTHSTNRSCYALRRSHHACNVRIKTKQPLFSLLYSSKNYTNIYYIYIYVYLYLATYSHGAHEVLCRILQHTQRQQFADFKEWERRKKKRGRNEQGQNLHTHTHTAINL